MSTFWYDESALILGDVVSGEGAKSETIVFFEMSSHCFSFQKTKI